MKRYNLILLGVISLGFLVRFLGSWYGYPFALGQFDEVFSVRQAMSFGATRSLRPIMLMYPTLHSYVLFGVYILYYLLGKILGQFSTPADFAFLYLTQPFILYFLARLISVICGGLTVLFTYLIAKKAYNPRVGLWAAWLLAINVTHISYSHWAKADIFMVCLLSLSLLFTCRILSERRLRNYLLAGLFAGLAIAAKYNAAFIVVSLLMVHILTKRGGFQLRGILDKKLFGYFLMMGLGFFIGSPYCILNAPFCYQEVLYDLNMLRFGEAGNINEIPWFWMVAQLLKDNLIFGGIFILGIVYCLIERHKEHWVLIPFVLLFAFFVGRSSKISLHYLLPILPAMAILSAVFLDRLFLSISHKNRFITGVVFLIILIAPFIKMLEAERTFLSKDSRIVAKEWIEENIPTHSKIAIFCLRYRDYPPLVSYGGEFTSVDYGPRAKATYKDKRLEALLGWYYLKHKTYRIYRLEKQIPQEEADKALSEMGLSGNVYLKPYYLQDYRSLQELRAIGIEYLILPDFLYGLYKKLPDKNHPLYPLCKRDQAYFNGLMNSKELRLVKEIDSAVSLGPTLRIYKILYQ